jgi:hypothetical protein
MLGFIITTLIFIGVMVGFSKIIDVETVKNNWEKYRCRPDVMLMADYYGHDSTENMEFCLKNGFDKRAKEAIGPFYTYLGKFVEVLMTMLNGLNSIRMIFATIVGSATQIFSEFSGRIQALFYRIQMSAIRLKMLMGRVFATMYAVIFMGMSGIKATQNFSNTFLFKFLDTFCFDPDTSVTLYSGTKIPIKDVKVGDVLKQGQKVTAVFRFAADGQTMVKLPGNIIVSTNHYVKYKGKWVLSKDHPDAEVHDDWNGHDERPLICLNTDTHTIPIGSYMFSDYDETDKGDAEAMKMATDIINGTKSTPETPVKEPISSEMACNGFTFIKTKDKPIPAAHITLGTELNHGKVVGIVKKECTKICKINGDYFAAGTCIWSEADNKWMRAYELSDVIESSPMVFYSFVVTPSATIETTSNTVFRDYVEVHSKDLETPYATMLNKTFQQTEC